MPVTLPAFVKKKWFAAAIVFGTLLFGVPAALADEPMTVAVKSNYPIWSNGQQLLRSAKPVVINDNVYLPLRELGEALGKQIEWNEQDGSITVNDLPSTYVWNGSVDLSAGFK